MSGPYTFAGAGGLVGLVQTEMQNATGEYFTATIVGGFVNQGQAELAREAKLLRATTALNITAGAAEVSLASISPALLEILDVSLPAPGSTDPLPLQLLSLSEVTAMDPQWRTRVGRPVGYLRFNEGYPKLRLYPIPDASYAALAGAPVINWDGYYGIIGSAGGITDAAWTAFYGLVSSTGIVYGALVIDYVAAATDMVANGDYPSIAAEYQEALIWYACARCCEIDVAIAQLQKAPMYWAKYQAKLAEAKAKVRDDYQSGPPRSVAFREL